MLASTSREDGGPWLTYGSLADAFADRDPPVDFETEYDALGAARKQIRAHDPKLLARLDFDQESSGTGIAAPTREDLVRVMSILDLTAG